MRSCEQREQRKKLKLFEDSKRQGNYWNAMGKQGHLSTMSNTSFDYTRNRSAIGFETLASMMLWPASKACQTKMHKPQAANPQKRGGRCSRFEACRHLADFPFFRYFAESHCNGS